VTEELEAKWRQLLREYRAYWSPGMLNGNDGTRYIAGEQWAWDDPHWPDLTDPATLGALLGQVRERWKDPAAHAVPDGDWHVRGDLPWAQYGTGDTEAEALLAALEAAP
jgi:hypothetical protein